MLQCTQSKYVIAVHQLLHQLQGRLVYVALRSNVHQQSLHASVEACEHRAHRLLARKASHWSSATWKSSESTSCWLGSSGFQAARAVTTSR